MAFLPSWRFFLSRIVSVKSGLPFPTFIFTEPGVFCGWEALGKAGVQREFSTGRVKDRGLVSVFAIITRSSKELLIYALCGR
jgi:hypothetical protein